MTDEDAEDELVIVPAPLISVQVPVPIDGMLPPKTEELLQTVWLGPATEVVGAATPVIVTVEDDEGQGALLIVH